MEDITKVEEETTQFWEKEKVFERSVEERPKDKQYVFYDGPPFATGVPHYGHILGLTSKDLFPRFWTMKGYRVERRWGWDCHGLPVENIAEKELGIKEKKEITEKIGVAKFNEFCRSQVMNFIGEWKKTVTRMGKWIDFDNAYQTMDNTYMESIWHIFKTLYEKDMIYEGKRVLMFCPRCETPVSNAEIAMDNSYRMVSEKTATVKFKITNQENTYLLAWTTTPWTLVGNVALAVNPELTYVKVKQGNDIIILVKEQVESMFKDAEVIEEVKGAELVGLEYEPLYHHEHEEKGHYVIDGGAEEITAEEGTGVVHMAVYGEFDYEMIKKYKLPVIQHVGHHGKLVKGPKEWEGMWFKDADKKVLEDLEERNLLFNAESYSHSYPFCYRCDTPLFYNAVDSWFVCIHKIKEKLIEKNKDINWYPGHLKDGRFHHIMETAPDWNISRNRFWATAIPVWKCDDCEEKEVIGSVKELQEKAKEKVADDVDLHKHIVDDIHLTCTKCKGNMTRIPEVIDCWVESGSMPYGAKHYPFENKEWYESNFPADFISEYISQVRTWFYYMHVLGVMLFDKAPFKHVVVSGNVLAEDGQKMSKSKGNFPDPWLIFEKYGADALRYYLMASPLMKAQDLNFQEEGVKESYRKIIMLLDNVKRFYTLFGAENKNIKSKSTHVLDRWILSKTQVLNKTVTDAFEAYDTITACKELNAFINELSTWYVRRSRDRFKSKDKEEKEAAVSTLADVLYTLSRLLAPTTPFVAERLFQEVKKADDKLPLSVHLDKWPTFHKAQVDESLNEQMNQVREIVRAALENREKAKIPVRQPLSKLTVHGASLPEELTQLILDEVNVKEVVYNGAETLQVELDTAITKELEEEGAFREVMRAVQDLRKKQQLTPGDEISLVVESPFDFSRFKEELKDRVGAVNCDFGTLDGDYQVKIEKTIKEKEVKIAFNVL